MRKPNVQDLLQQEMSRKQFLAFSVFAVASVFGFVGLLKLINSHAATPTASFEAEDGTITGGSAATVNDSTASGASAVKFGTDSQAFVLNTTRPSETNTGVPANVTLTTMTKSMATTKGWGTFQIHSSTGLELFVPASGVTISGVVIPWIVNVTKPDVTFQYCKFTGPQGIAGGANATKAQNPDLGLVICNSSNTVITECEVNPTVPYSGSTGIIGHHYRAYRCKVKHCVDYFNAFNTTSQSARADVIIEGCYGTQITLFLGDPYHQSDQFPATHNDAVQWQGNFGLKIHGCYFYQVWSPRGDAPPDGTEKDSAGNWICNTAYGGARIFTCTPNVAPCGDADIQYNWGFAGITYSLAIPKSGIQTSSTGLGVFANNRDLGHHRGNGIAYASTMPWNADWPAGQASGYKFTDTTHGNVLVADNGTTTPSIIAIQGS